jgi:hypothetical protein
MKEVMEMEDKESWRLDIDEEMVALRKNDTWDLVPFPNGCKWVFKKNIGLDGNVEKHKARLVEKGYSQVEGIYFGETFSLVVKLTYIRFLLSITVTFDLEIEQMDVKTAVLHGDLKEDIYMKQENNYVEKGKESLVSKLKKKIFIWS